MPRPLRLQDAGLLRHVITRGNDGQSLFKTEEDYKKYISLLELARKEYQVKIYNYVLMDNHVQLLVEPQEDGALSKFMQIVTKEYAKYFNKTYNRRGHVFEGRFKSFIVQEEKYYFACSRTIDFNAVNAGAVDDPKNYKWSGYKALASAEKSILKLDVHKLYKGLGSDEKERQIGYRALAMNYHGEELELMDRRAAVLGDKEFKKKVKGR